MRGRIFVSYRRDDIPFAAGRLSDRLEEQFPGASVFMDVDTIEPGADFFASIKDAVGSCDVLIALIGPKWLSVQDEYGRRRIDMPDDFVALEIATALTRNIPVIPILVDGATMPQRQDLPEGIAALARRNAVPLDHQTFRTDIERILPVIDRAISKAQAVQPVSSTSLVGAIGSRPAQSPQHQVSSSHSAPVASTDSAPTIRLPRVEVYQNQIAVVRTAYRIGLWWLIAFMSLITSFGIISTAIRPQNLGGAIVGIALLMGATVGVFRLLIKEVAKQRLMLGQPTVKHRDDYRYPLSTRHIRMVAILTIGGSVGLAVLMVMTPVNPAP